MKNENSAKKKKKSKVKDELIKELSDMIKDIDEEGLIFLIQQANVLLYNKRVEEINRKITGMKVQKTTRKTTTQPQDYAVYIEETKDGKYFYIILNNSRVFFTLEEMKKLVKICHVSEDERDASERLYNWFSRNRKDLLIDGQIGDSNNPFLANIYSYIINKYKVKNRN